ncbi:MAG: AAA-like domain-containing protein, partial [Cyanobacteria bacterium J06659_2]
MADSITFVAGGTVLAGGGVYIPRQADQELLALCRSGAFAYVLTPRQMGKSSLMVQTSNLLREQGIRTATVDLTTIGTQLDAEAWHLGLLTTICRQLGLVRQLMQWWQAHQQLGVTQRLTQFIEEVLLTEVSERIVIFVDEIDTTLNLDFTDDFFIAIRSFYLSRAEDSKFDRLSFVLFGVATPSDLIRNPQRTPFNIGRRVDLTDFTFEEARSLADGFALPPAEAQQVLRWVLGWTGGHPYLTQRLCQTLREENRSHWSEFEVAGVVSRIFLGTASQQDTNLQFVRDMLTRRSPDLAGGLTIYREVLLNRQLVADEEQSLVKSHLKLSGVVKRRQDGVLQVRNSIYRAVFDRVWVGEHLPVNWKKQLRRIAIGLGIAFWIAPVPSAGLIWMQYREAEAARQEAVRQSQIATQERQIAEEARQVAVQQRQEAERQGSLAEAQRLRAEAASQVAGQRQREAETARQEEVKQREIAEEQRQKAEVARREEENQRQLAQQREQEAIAARKAEEGQRLIAESGQKIAAQGREEARLITQVTSAEVRFAANQEIDALLEAMKAGKRLQAIMADPDRERLEPNTKSRIVSALRQLLGKTREANQLEGDGGRVWSVSFSPDGDTLASASDDGTVKLWTLDGSLIETFEGDGGIVLSVSFSPDGDTLASASSDGTVKLWTQVGRGSGTVDVDVGVV